MRHKMGGSRRFGRRPAERASMLKNMAVSLIEHEKIRTTDAKASEVQSSVERLITLSMQDTPQRRLTAQSRLGSRRAVAKLFDDLGPRLSGRAGGYTRIYKLGSRHGDGATVVQIEILD